MDLLSISISISRPSLLAYMPVLTGTVATREIAFLQQHDRQPGHFGSFSLHGTGSVGLGMELLDVKELLKGEAFVQDPECDSWDFTGREVGTDEVVEHPVAIQSSLQSILLLGIGVGASSVAGEASSYGTVEGFEVIGVNLLFQERLWRLGMFPEGSLILRTFASSLMLLGSLVLEAYSHPFLSTFGGRPTFPVRSTS